MAKRIYNICIAIFVSLVIYLRSGSVLQTLFDPIKYVVLLTALIFVWSVFFELYLWMNRIIRKRNIAYLPLLKNSRGNCANSMFHLLFIGIIIVTICSAICSLPNDLYTNIFFIATIITAVGISLKYSFQSFVKAYLHIMVVLTIIAIFGHILVNYTNLLSALPTFENLNNIPYKVGIIFNYIPTKEGRNCGAFWEPGLFATACLFALIFEVQFKKGKTNYFRLILFSVGILLSTSSAGYVLWFLFVLFFLVKKLFAFQKYERQLKKIAIVAFFVGGVVLIGMDYIISHTSLAQNEYFQKLLFENLFTSKRMNAVFHNLKVFFEAPIFGQGVNVVSQYVEHALYVADTSTSTFILAVMGIGGIIYTFGWCYGIMKLDGLNIFAKLILILIVICIVNKEPHLFNLFSWTVYFYLLKNATEKSKETTKMKAIYDPLY